MERKYEGLNLRSIESTTEKNYNKENKKYEWQFVSLLTPQFGKCIFSLFEVAQFVNVQI